MNWFLALALFSSLVEAKSLHDELEAIRHKYQLPSLTAALLQNGQIKEIASTGVRKIGLDIAVTPEDKFHIGSCTKSMVSTLIAMFIEEGKLKWDSTLSELFYDLDVHDDYKNVTLEMLLSHRGGMHNGLSFYDEALEEEYRQSKTPVEDRAITTRALLKRGPLLKPDTQDFYSNSSYVVAAHALERLSTKSWEMLTVERIFSPLGMKDCGFGSVSDPNVEIPLQPWGHYFDSNTGKIVSHHKDNPIMWGPAGRVHCPMKDWAKYLQMHIDGFMERPTLLKSSSFKNLHNPYINSGWGYTPGGWLAAERDWAGGLRFAHNGTNLVNFAKTSVAPLKNSALMVFTNMGGNESFSGTDSVLDKTAEGVEEAINVLIDRHFEH
jgi:CubicO group peptidase (beta-lactamase class C family)